jgi:hypothetical protein
MTHSSDSNKPFNPLAPEQTVAEIVAMFDNLDLALGWAIDAFENGFLMPDEFVAFCKDLKAYHDPYARSVSLTAWVEEVNLRCEAAQNITDAV